MAIRMGDVWRAGLRYEPSERWVRAYKEGELVEKGIAARDQLQRIEIRAPTSGTIHQLAVHTIGGVIKTGETIMEIVPDSDELQVEAHVPPKDIDHVHMGQDAFVRFSAFNQRTTPQLTGQVSFV